MKKNIQKEILDKIKRGELKMKPRWQFEVKEKGKKGVALGTLILAAIAITTVIFFVREYEPWTLWELGEVGKQIVIEDFPYWWFLAGATMVVGSTAVIKNVGDNYKRSARDIWTMTIITTVVITTLVWLIWGLF
ncbi:hypothetical protein HYV64_03730 [Candidatus Shapirobacteria bacterium]|nr:hypothetical protein [Candidatus Shapirobacteria bacterium]